MAINVTVGTWSYPKQSYLVLGWVELPICSFVLERCSHHLALRAAYDVPNIQAIEVPFRSTALSRPETEHDAWGRDRLVRHIIVTDLSAAVSETRNR